MQWTSTSSEPPLICRTNRDLHGRLWDNGVQCMYAGYVPSSNCPSAGEPEADLGVRSPKGALRQNYTVRNNPSRNAGVRAFPWRTPRAFPGILCPACSRNPLIDEQQRESCAKLRKAAQSCAKPQLPTIIEILPPLSWRAGQVGGVRGPEVENCSTQRTNFYLGTHYVSLGAEEATERGCSEVNVCSEAGEGCENSEARCSHHELVVAQGLDCKTNTTASSRGISATLHRPATLDDRIRYYCTSC